MEYLTHRLSIDHLYDVAGFVCFRKLNKQNEVGGGEQKREGRKKVNRNITILLITPVHLHN